ncbi:OmpA family protein [Streptomyces sp. NPDC021224]|uniref:OmpA family protein n=1 Tax=unclassified Streptomyces TaxID=2593676 RepID=UPI0037BC73A7
MKPAAAAASITLSVVLLAGGTAVAVAPAAGAAGADTGTPTAPPAPGDGSQGQGSAEHVDASSPNLRLPEGSKLAPAKVLDIVSVSDESSVAADQPEQREETSNATVTYALQSEVAFAKNSAKLSAAATSRVQAIAADINARHVTSPIRVFGFTDDLGSSEHGVTLSRQRAQAVYQVLAAALGSAGDASHTFQVRGYGEDYPIADNSTESGRQQNRRVEITFTPPAA